MMLPLGAGIVLLSPTDKQMYIYLIGSPTWDA
jgi:hypothetical protein